MLGDPTWLGATTIGVLYPEMGVLYKTPPKKNRHEKLSTLSDRPLRPL